MKTFYSGIVFAAGMAVFGKIMYEIGKSKGEKETIEKTKIVLTTVEKMTEIFTKDRKKEES